MEKRLYKTRYGNKVDGVCAGLAKYFNIDPTAVRVAWVVFSLLGGSGLLAYIVCAIIIPREPENIPPQNMEQPPNRN